MLTQDDAKEALYRLHLHHTPDYHTLSSSEVENVLAEADKVGYRRPKHANGSRARYFYTHLCRRAAGPKYCYLWVLQGQYGQGWEDLTASEDRREVRSDLRAYRENEGGVYRVIRRRELNGEV